MKLCFINLALMFFYYKDGQELSDWCHIWNYMCIRKILVLLLSFWSPRQNPTSMWEWFVSRPNVLRLWETINFYRFVMIMYMYDNNGPVNNAIYHFLESAKLVVGRYILRIFHKFINFIVICNASSNNPLRKLRISNQEYI